jgi:hypothetical protein
LAVILDGERTNWNVTYVLGKDGDRTVHPVQIALRDAHGIPVLEVKMRGEISWEPWHDPGEERFAQRIRLPVCNLKGYVGQIGGFVLLTRMGHGNADTVA